ncbi:MAG: 16S rRNA (guanine(527)-N(7))-methyltransferase RsmG [Bacteroidales bacterium]|jgi:16S rRNA (guanine527-N7)-methyltransferase|nr:16S rRNA (guanine(527)-N(7))-methyltransferase RsmG [Bacteroidales bacterium]
MELIKKYFPDLDPDQYRKYEQLRPLYQEWNNKINLISRKDFQFLYERHVLHSLAIAKAFNFPNNTAIMDAGTGGGFPGIPLAIYFPNVNFHLVDSTGKKIRAVENIAQNLDLKNVRTEINRAELINNKYDYVVSRAVAPLKDIIKWTWKKILTGKNADPKPGIIYLKGGEVHEELNQIDYNYRIIRIKHLFKEEFFEHKLIIHIFR